MVLVVGIALDGASCVLVFSFLLLGVERYAHSFGGMAVYNWAKLGVTVWR